MQWVCIAHPDVIVGIQELNKPFPTQFGYLFEDLGAKLAAMNLDNVSFDFVRAYPIVGAQLERANFPWFTYLVQMSYEFLTSSECSATMITARSGFARRANAQGSIDGLGVDNDVCSVCGFRWWRLRHNTGG